MTQQVAYYALVGGEDLVTPPLQVKPGKLLYSQNYEPGEAGGYTRLQGYERFDGQPKPSESTFILLPFDAGSNEPAVDDIITGSGSSFTAIVAGFVLTSGDWSTNDAVGTLAVHEATGVFVDNETLTNTTQTNTLATQNGAQEAGGAPTDALYATWLQATIEWRRTQILVVPGEGDILGVWQYEGVKYAFRNNAGTVTLDSGASGSVDSITVGGVEVMSASVNFTSSLTATATAVAANITALGLYTATSSSTTITISGSGSATTAVISSATTISTTDTDTTAAVMHKSTASGWSTVDLGLQLAFTTGAVNKPTIGETITGSAGTGAKTAIVAGYSITSGTFADGDAVGILYLHTLSGTITNGTLLGGTSGVTAANAGTTSAITLPAGGKYEFWNYNFFGRASGNTMYFTNGVGFAMSFDGTGLSFIDLGMGTIYPTHLRPHKNHLFLTYDASLLHSDLGNPYVATAIGGAAEFAVGDRVNGLDIVQGDVLAVLSRNSTRLLYGSSTLNWDLKEHSLVSGAREWTIQRILNTRYLEDRGFTQLNAVFAFGDFKENTFSQPIAPLVSSKLGTEVDSVTVREKDQYRCFFSDGTGLICRIQDGQQYPQFTRMEYPVPVLTCNTGENSAGQEEVYFGSNDGYVYQMDKGTSFDGAAIDYALRLPFNNLRSPRNKKRFFKAILEIEALGLGGVTLQFTPDFSYGSTFTPKAVQQTLDVKTGAAYWGDNMEWNDFFWGAETPGSAEAYVEGSGQNMAFLIRGSSIYEDIHTITSVLLQYKVRGLKR